MTKTETQESIDRFIREEREFQRRRARQRLLSSQQAERVRQFADIKRRSLRTCYVAIGWASLIGAGFIAIAWQWPHFQSWLSHI